MQTPRHEGACGREDEAPYYIGYVERNSRGQPRMSGPPACVLGEGLTTLHPKKNGKLRNVLPFVLYGEKRVLLP
jgi:hypothetical protein